MKPLGGSLTCVCIRVSDWAHGAIYTSPTSLWPSSLVIMILKHNLSGTDFHILMVPCLKKQTCISTRRYLKNITLFKIKGPICNIFTVLNPKMTPMLMPVFSPFEISIPWWNFCLCFGPCVVINCPVSQPGQVAGYTCKNVNPARQHRLSWLSI